MHTFESIVTYVEDHLPNLQESSRVSARVTAAIVSSEAYATLEAENKRLKSSQVQAQSKKRKGGKGKGKNQPQKKNRGNKTGNDERRLKYCHAHGTQHTHTSSECKLMAGNTNRFTPAMRNAADSSHPPGGSTKILGQDAQWGSREVTTHSASSAPTLQSSVAYPDFNDDEEAARERISSQASCMNGTLMSTMVTSPRTMDLCESSPICYLAMIFIWILSTDKNGKDVVPDLPGMGRGERISISLPVIPAAAIETF